MSMGRKIFRPMAGQTHGRFAAFRMNGTLSYRGDVVHIDTTAPASQGQTAGVLDGQTLGTTDFLYVIGNQSHATNATIAGYSVAGVIEGKTVGDRNTTTALAEDGVVIVQVAGVHSQVWMSATDGVAGWIALADSANTFGQARAASIISVTASLTAVDHAFVVGHILTGTASASRGTTATVGNAVWIRCGDVV